MKDKIESIKQEVEKKLENLQDLKRLNELRVEYLGKKGQLTGLLRSMGNINAEERPKMGALVNSAKEEIEARMKEIEKELEQLELKKRLEKEEIDIWKTYLCQWGMTLFQVLNLKQMNIALKG